MQGAAHRDCPATSATVKVAAGKISGSVAPDGTVTGKWGGNPMTGKFDGEHFSGTYAPGQCGVGRKIFLDRAK